MDGTRWLAAALALTLGAQVMAHPPKPPPYPVYPYPGPGYVASYSSFRLSGPFNGFLSFNKGYYGYPGYDLCPAPVVPFAPPVIIAPSYPVPPPAIDPFLLGNGGGLPVEALPPSLRQPVRAAAPADGPRPAKVADVPKPRDEIEIKAEMQRLILKGNDAFGAAEYAEAARLYQQATGAAPLDPTGYFHLAQAQLATGKIADAGVSIQRGLRLQPNWPSAPFRPRALYRDFEGDYDRHLGELADLVSKNMNDDGLLFLLGYQLWFDGRRDEAAVLFQRSAALAHDATLPDRFLKATKPPL